MRVVERQCRCYRCGKTKPWSAFWARTKWPDGSMKLPQSMCKPCARKAAAERSRRRRERMARDEEYRAEQRAAEARWRAAYWKRVREQRAELDAQPQRCPLPIGPFREWLQGYLDEQCEGNRARLAKRLGVSESTVRHWLGGRHTVSLSRADEVLCRVGRQELLDELYPDLFADAAA